MQYRRTEEVLLKIDHVNLSFGSTVVLRDVNAQITDIEREEVTGQVVCFLGPSGIGKTQLSRCIAGLQRPTSGTIQLRNAEPTRAGTVGMVPQNYPLFEYLTVAHNIQLAGRCAGLSTQAVNEKATPFIEAFELGDHLGKYPKELSGGTRQRVAIVRQLMCAGNYMVMDEPFSGLDLIMKRKAMDAVSKLASLDTYNTIIVVTHDIASGCAVADTVWMMGLDKGIEGARLVEQYDLAALGLAWHPDITGEAAFQSFVRDIEVRFKELKP